MDLDFVNLSVLSDAEVAAHMRKLNYEKFKTLVRMHLSFELELNTDEFDLPCHEIVYEDKGKIKKWSRLSKKHKFSTGGATTGCGSTIKGSISAENSPMESLHQQINSGFMLHLEELKEFLLLEKNLNQEGIFRKTGSASRQNELRQQIQQDKPLDLAAGDYSAHDCATVFKGYLADLSEPLLTDAHYPAHLQMAPLCLGSGSSVHSSASTSSSTRPPNPERVKREQHLLNSVQLLLLLLPDENRHLLEHIIELLHAVARNANVNKMSPENLATIFAPHLICPRNLPPEALHYISKKMSSIIAYMVCKGLEIFEMPAKLSTDIRAYFHERKRKKTMSPEQTLDESISDISTVNTVYTFVDREKTAAAHSTNTTDTELAQLYAHIQSLPESSKKRRLIKQFNKQNGQGTPLQLVVMNRLKSSRSEATRSAKSISDSIKKHIFHKGLMSRTPKRTAAATATPTGVGAETPNYATNKNPKLRVLFRSPAPCAANACASSATATPSHTRTSSSSLHSINCSNANTNSSYTTKTLNHHPLQKSISSTSLLLNASASLRKQASLSIDEIESCSISSSSSDGMPQARATSNTINKFNCSVSAPVSRQTSNESNISSTTPASGTSAMQHFPMSPANYYTTPLKLITEAARQLVGHVEQLGGERKTVAWDEEHLLEIEEISNPCTPVQHNSNELKLRYKSEPNLSRTVAAAGAAVSTQDSATKYTSGSRSLTRKLMKGVSMSNLRFPFSTPESTKRLVRSVSSTLRRCSSDNQQLDTATNVVEKSVVLNNVAKTMTDSLEDLDDETFEDNPDDELDSDSNDDVDANNNDDDNNISEAAVSNDTVRKVSAFNIVDGLAGCSNSDSNSRSNSLDEIPSGSGSGVAMTYQQLLLQQSGLYRNLDSMASTPSFLLGRRSMSPITKSTQRMPKAMQESIMTPRSRKPVMVLTAATLSSSDPNHTICQPDCISFREQDEDESSTRSKDETDFGTYKTEHFSSPQLQFEDATSIDSYRDMLRRRKVSAESTDVHSSNAHKHEMLVYTNTVKCDALSSNFKEYLLSRSVLTASPVDSSFSSQPDDFGSPTKYEELNDSQLSPSLLYCLDGNSPDENDEKLQSTEMFDGTTVIRSTEKNESYSQQVLFPNRQLQSAHFAQTNNARKRAATNELEKIAESTLDAVQTAGTSADIATTVSRHKSQLQANKENNERVEGYLRSRKLLISEYPGETSF